MPPRYRVHRAGIGDDTDVSQLANVVSCNLFNLPLSWFCFDYPLAGTYEVIGDRSPEIVTTIGIRKLRTKSGREVTMEVNSSDRAVLPDGSQVSPFTFEELLAKNAFAGGCQSELEALESNPEVPGDARLLGLRRTSAKGDVIWEQVYLVKRRGGIIKNSGEVLTVDPVIGFNSFVFPNLSRFAYAATANVPFYEATSGTTSVDPQTRVELATPVLAIDLMSGSPAADDARIRSISATKLIGAYSVSLSARAVRVQSDKASCPIDTSDPNKLSDAAQAVISSFFN